MFQEFSVCMASNFWWQIGCEQCKHNHEDPVNSVRPSGVSDRFPGDCWDSENTQLGSIKGTYLLSSCGNSSNSIVFVWERLGVNLGTLKYYQASQDMLIYLQRAFLIALKMHPSSPFCLCRGHATGFAITRCKLLLEAGVANYILKSNWFLSLCLSSTK